MKRYLLLLAICVLHLLKAHGQRPYGHEAAVAADELTIVGWATGCTIARGYQDLADTSIGFATVGDEFAPTGPAKENGVLSLGDGGIALLTFDGNIYNGPGVDFAVFENGFSFNNDSTFYLELAFVEVSSDGNRFVRFPARYMDDTLIQKDFITGSSPLKTKNLAGNYAFGYGTPFDLEELKDSSAIDISRITHIRIIDAVGSMESGYKQNDSHGVPVNDPWPTPFASSGFDLDAIGVLHLQTGIHEVTKQNLSCTPNPANGSSLLSLTIRKPEKVEVSIFTITGALMMQQNVDGMQPKIQLNGLPSGVYYVTINAESGIQTGKLLIE